MQVRGRGTVDVGRQIAGGPGRTKNGIAANPDTSVATIASRA